MLKTLDTHPSNQQMLELFGIILPLFDKAFVCIDALDELASSTRLGVLDFLRKVELNRVHSSSPVENMSRETSKDTSRLPSQSSWRLARRTSTFFFTRNLNGIHCQRKWTMN